MVCICPFFVVPLQAENKNSVHEKITRRQPLHSTPYTLFQEACQPIQESVNLFRKNKPKTVNQIQEKTYILKIVTFLSPQTHTSTCNYMLKVATSKNTHLKIPTEKMTKKWGVLGEIYNYIIYNIFSKYTSTHNFMWKCEKVVFFLCTHFSVMCQPFQTPNLNKQHILEIYSLTSAQHQHNMCQEVVCWNVGDQLFGISLFLSHFICKDIDFIIFDDKVS